MIMASAPASEQVLNAFNEIPKLRRAYTYDRQQIFGFLHHVIDNGYLYDIQDCQLPSLRKTLAQIEMLCPPNGSDFASPGLEPHQTIKRRLNPEWDPRNPSRSSQFLLDPIWHDAVPYWGLFDMLGLFVSIVGVAPSGATKRNFYLPLTAMYAKWCNTLAAPVPTMYNCTWIAYGPGKGTFFLGASLKGFRSPHSITGPWNEVIQEGRFALINDAAMIESGNTMKNCPEQRENDTFIRFGNCAETYPFVHLFQHSGNPAAVHGIALQRQGVLPANYEDSLSGSVWQNVRSLCANCRELTQMRRGCVANFDPLADASGAPP